ncbi:thiol-disulfide isomerase/thioredoxin [Microbacterium marinum]|uniref:Thiol-disulfide isomerase/thioredoxin n=1 Tax=Microbacterium marinum TaxID=421115 RepID=A0A7W7BSS3_9MICO|nr:TlpA disulfide reductase family protein [Microbacterium marinum]MBB4668156.1 thiol-disulfide isomerase/thioredoxin [Microbacterium marinum]
MTVTRNRRTILSITALMAVAILVVVLALTALNRGAGAGTTTGGASGNGVERIETTSTEGEPVAVPGERPTVLYFMASWCFTCVPQAESMKELEAEYADRAQFVAVDVTPENTKAEVDAFRELAGFPEHPYVVDQTGQLSKKYEIISLDSTVVIAPDSEVLARADAQPMRTEALQTFLEETLP